MTTAVHGATQEVAPVQPARNGHVRSLEDLLAEPLPSEEIDTVLGKVLVHAITAGDAGRIGRLTEDSWAATMAMVAAGIGATAEQAERLDARLVAPIAAAVLRLSGMTPEAAAEAVESLKATPNVESSPA